VAHARHGGLFTERLSTQQRKMRKRFQPPSAAHIPFCIREVARSQVISNYSRKFMGAAWCRCGSLMKTAVPQAAYFGVTRVARVGRGHLAIFVHDFDLAAVPKRDRLSYRSQSWSAITPE
jgi:hypothetical protein